MLHIFFVAVNPIVLLYGCHMRFSTQVVMTFQVTSGRKILHRAHLKLPDDWLTRTMPVRSQLHFKNARKSKAQSIVSFRRQNGSMSGLGLPVEVCVHKLRPYGYRDKARHDGKASSDTPVKERHVAIIYLILENSGLTSEACVCKLYRLGCST